MPNQSEWGSIPCPWRPSQVLLNINWLLEHGILVPCQSPWNTPLLPVKKPETNDFQPVQHLREINKWVEDIHATVPNSCNLLSSLSPEHQVCSVLDLKDAFFSLTLEAKSQPLLLSNGTTNTGASVVSSPGLTCHKGSKIPQISFYEALHGDLKDYQCSHLEVSLI